MSHTFHMPLARRAGALAAALAAAFVLALLPAASAEAHDEFLGSTPAADSTVDAVPDDLTLTFSGAIATDPGASEVAVTDASGASLIDGSPTAQDNVLTQPLRGEASGIVTVLWKVVSSDGHPISGQFSFTVTAASPSPTASPTATATPEPTPTPSASATTTATPVPAGDATIAEAWPWILAGLLVAAVGGAVLYLLASRARREKELAENRVRAPGTAPGTGSEPPAEH